MIFISHLLHQYSCSNYWMSFMTPENQLLHPLEYPSTLNGESSIPSFQDTRDLYVVSPGEGLNSVPYERTSAADHQVSAYFFDYGSVSGRPTVAGCAIGSLATADAYAGNFGLIHTERPSEQTTQNFVSESSTPSTPVYLPSNSLLPTTTRGIVGNLPPSCAIWKEGCFTDEHTPNSDNRGTSENIPDQYCGEYLEPSFHVQQWQNYVTSSETFEFNDQGLFGTPDPNELEPAKTYTKHTTNFRMSDPCDHLLGQTEPVGIIGYKEKAKVGSSGPVTATSGVKRRSPDPVSRKQAKIQRSITYRKGTDSRKAGSTRDHVEPAIKKRDYTTASQMIADFRIDVHKANLKTPDWADSLFFNQNFPKKGRKPKSDRSVISAVTEGGEHDTILKIQRAKQDFKEALDNLKIHLYQLPCNDQIISTLSHDGTNKCTNPPQNESRTIQTDSTGHIETETSKDIFLLYLLRSSIIFKEISAKINLNRPKDAKIISGLLCKDFECPVHQALHKENHHDGKGKFCIIYRNKNPNRPHSIFQQILLHSVYESLHLKIEKDMVSFNLEPKTKPEIRRRIPQNFFKTVYSIIQTRYYVNNPHRSFVFYHGLSDETKKYIKEISVRITELQKRIVKAM